MMKTHLDVDHDGEGSDADIGDGQEEEEEVLLLWSNRQVRLVTVVSILAASHFCSVSPLDLSFCDRCFIRNEIFLYFQRILTQISQKLLFTCTSYVRGV